MLIRTGKDCSQLPSDSGLCKMLRRTDSLRLSRNRVFTILLLRLREHYRRGNKTRVRLEERVKGSDGNLLALTKPLLLLVVLVLCPLFFGGPTTQLPHTHTHGILFFLMNAWPWLALFLCQLFVAYLSIFCL